MQVSENVLCRLGLKRSEFKESSGIPLEDKIDKRIAKITHPIKDNHLLVLAPVMGW